MRLHIQKIALALVWLPLIINSSDLKGQVQSGYSISILDELQVNPDVDDIIYHDHLLYLRGNVYLESIKLIGAFVAILDTFGELRDVYLQYDTTLASHMVTNTPTRISINKKGQILIPNYYYQGNRLALTVFEADGQQLFTQEFFWNERTIFPFTSHELDGYYYVFGFAQRNDYLLDDYVIKTDSMGNMIWMKLFGQGGYWERMGDVIVNPDYTFTIASSQETKDYSDGRRLRGWRKPWIYTIDTSGAILHQWKGEENDTRTRGGGPFHRRDDGSWIITSFDRTLVVYSPEYSEVWVTPTITKLDSNFNLIWKHQVADFDRIYFQIPDMKYDPVRDEYVYMWNKRVSYPHKDKLAVLIVKFKDTGEVLWEALDTLPAIDKELHWNAGLDVAPSGSIYVSGYIIDKYPTRHSLGFLLKITPDGCIDRLCMTTSLEEQIRTWGDEVSVYPNPVQDEITVHLRAPEPHAEVWLYDMQGRQRFRQPLTVGKNHFRIDIPPGLYMCTVRSQGRTLYSSKLVKP